MKFQYLISFLCLTSGAFAAETTRTLAFERDSGIYVAQANGKDAHKVAKGNFPDISPDGRWVAFTTDDSTDKSPVRHIAIVESGGGKPKLLKSITSDNSYAPKWSPDGAHLLFNTFVDKDWHIGIVNADGSGYRIVKKAVSQSEFFSAPAWAADGQSFFSHDLDVIYQLDLAGKELHQWKVEKVTHGSTMDSGAGLAASADGKSLLIEADLPDQHDRQDWAGPQPTIWILDVNSGKARRLSGKNVFATAPTWAGSDHYLCTVHLDKAKNPAIYEGGVSGKSWELLVKNGENASISQK